VSVPQSAEHDGLMKLVFVATGNDCINCPVSMIISTSAIDDLIWKLDH
jgi:hypothetical protein